MVIIGIMTTGHNWNPVFNVGIYVLWSNVTLHILNYSEKIVLL